MSLWQRGKQYEDFCADHDCNAAPIKTCPFCINPLCREHFNLHLFPIQDGWECRSRHQWLVLRTEIAKAVRKGRK